MQKVLLLSILFISSASMAQKVTTVAGTAKKSGATTSGATASSVLFNKPYGMALDANQNVWVTNEGSHAIFMWQKSDGKFYVRAGNQGNLGYKDDNGINARFDRPRGIAVGAKIYIADAGNNTIRQMDQFTSIAKAQSVSLLAGDKSSSGFKNGTGSVAQFNTPMDVAVDSKGNIYVADQQNHCVRKITALGVVTTFAGQPNSSGSTLGHKDSKAKFKLPTGLFIDGDDNVYVADKGNGRICMVDATTDTVTAVVRGLYGPDDVFVDALGTIIVSDGCQISATNATYFGMDTLEVGSSSLNCGFKNDDGTAAILNGARTVLQTSASTYMFADMNNHVIRNIEVAPCDIVKAKIRVRGSQPFCAGDSLELEGSQSFGNAWTFTGGTGAASSHYAKAKGLYKLKVSATIGITACSDTTSVWVKEPFPEPKPKIVAFGPLGFCPGGDVKLAADQDYREYLWSTFDRKKSIVSNESDVYTLEVTDKNGCLGTSPAVTTTLFKTTQPEITPNSDFEICDGDSAMVTATTGYASYDWTNGASTESMYVKKAVALRVTVVDDNGCETKSKLPLINVTVSPKPGKPDVASTNDSVYTSAVSSTYNWYKDGAFWKSTAVAYVIADANADYSVEIEDSKGCKNISDEVAVVITSNAVRSTLPISVYPIPASDMLNVQISRNFTYNVRDISGKVLMTGSNDRTIATQSLSEGTYLLEVMSEDQAAHIRFNIIR